MNGNGLMVKFQSCFRAGFSSDTALHGFLNNLLELCRHTVLLPLNLSGAFNTVDHKILFGHPVIICQEDLSV